jgi:outer membrane biosynthesis protein TonB
MKYTLTIEANESVELLDVLERLGKKVVPAAVVDAQVPKSAPMIEPVPPRPRGRAPKPDTAVNIPENLVEPAKEPVKETAKLSVVPKKEEPKEEEKKEITILDVRRALTEYLQANDEAAAARLLAKHGKTDRLSKLAPQYFEAVLNAAVTPVQKDDFNDDISTVGSA